MAKVHLQLLWLMGLVCTLSFILMIVIISTVTLKEPPSHEACLQAVIGVKNVVNISPEDNVRRAKREVEIEVKQMRELQEVNQEVNEISKSVLTEKPKPKVPQKKQGESLLAGFKEFIKLRPLPVDLREVDFVISNKDICAGKQPSFLLILCVSEYFNSDNRKIIRQTWASIAKTGAWPLVQNRFNVKLVFVLANPGDSVVKNAIVKEENEEFGDLVIVDIEENVQSQSKRFMAGLKWVSQYCNTTKYLLRVADHTMVHIPNLVSYLRPFKLQERGLIIGHVEQQKKVFRGGRWAVNQTVYPFDVYPPSAVGASYVISVNIVEKLLNAANHLPYLYIEDVFITGIAREAIRAELKHKKEFAPMLGSQPGACALHEKGQISVSRVKTRIQREIWHALHKPTCKEN